MKNYFLLIALSLPVWSFGQTATNDSIGLAIAPGLTPVIAHKQIEVGLFNSLSTYRTDDTSGYRGAQLINFLQVQRGFSRQNRLSAGIDLIYTNLRFGSSEDVAPFAALGSSPASGIGRHSFSAAGLRVRYVPFIRHYEFTLQSTLYFPVASPANRGVLGEDRVRFSIQANYATLIASGWYVVGQLSPQVRFSNPDRQQTTWELPLNAYLIKRMLTTTSGQRLYLFANAGYYSSFEKRYKAGLRQVNWQLNAGAGAQWVFNPQWSLSLGWQGLPAYDDTTGIKKGTYGAISLGVRYVGMR